MTIRELLRSTFKENNELGCLLLMIILPILMIASLWLLARLGILSR
jgi:hypothetical protein